MRTPNKGYVPPGHRLPSDAIVSPRLIDVEGKPDVEQNQTKYILIGLERLRQQLVNIARVAENRSRVFDEYQVSGYTADNETIVTVLPAYDFVPEKVESIIITGPPGNVTVILGDRNWSLTIPASGILVIAPIAMLLNRNDPRQITGSAGNYNLELMGVADERFSA